MKSSEKEEVPSCKRVGFSLCFSRAVPAIKKKSHMDTYKSFG